MRSALHIAVILGAVVFTTACPPAPEPTSDGKGGGTPAGETTREAAVRLVGGSIAQAASVSRPGIPEFLTWANKPDAGCPPASAADPDVAVRFGLTFFFSPAVMARLCEPLAADPVFADHPIIGSRNWWQSADQNPGQITPFPEGSVTAEPFWRAVQRSDQGVRVQLQTLEGIREVLITTANIPAGPANCNGSGAAGVPPAEAAGMTSIPLEEFFFIRVNQAEADQIGSTFDVACGDFLALVGMNLVYKEAGDWIWTASWWEDQSELRNPDLTGTAEDPAWAGAWSNYAMSASRGDEEANIRNPWRPDQLRTCASCHLESATLTVPLNLDETKSISFDSLVFALEIF